MTTVSVLPVQTYLAGVHNVGPVAIGDSITSIGLAIQWCTDADLTVWASETDEIAFDIQISLDGGVSWSPWFQGSGFGGIHVNPKNGLQQPSMNVQGSLPEGTGRLMKAAITLSADIKTGVVVTVL